MKTEERGTAANPLTYEEWVAEGERRFGKDTNAWKTVCPVCKHVASAAEYIAAGAPQNQLGFSCIGRWTRDAWDLSNSSNKTPCHYAGFGLFKLNPVHVIAPDGGVHTVFAFAEVA